MYRNLEDVVYYKCSWTPRVIASDCPLLNSYSRPLYQPVDLHVHAKEEDFFYFLDRIFNFALPL